jgi:hypothetical protein
VEKRDEPVKQKPTDSLLVWCIATLQVTLLVLIGLLAGFASGGLGNALGELSTLEGIGLFMALWAVSVYCAHRAAHGIDPAKPTARLLLQAAIWGGFTGAFFLILILVPFSLIGSIAMIDKVSPLEMLQSMVATLFFGAAGFGVAFVIGFIIGLALAPLDWLILVAARKALKPGHLPPQYVV